MIEDFIVEFYDADGAEQSMMLYRRLTFGEALGAAALRMLGDEKQKVAKVVVRKAHGSPIERRRDGGDMAGHLVEGRMPFASSWRCSSCQYVNSAGAETCRECGRAWPPESHHP